MIKLLRSETLPLQFLYFADNISNIKQRFTPRTKYGKIPPLDYFLYNTRSLHICNRYRPHHAWKIFWVALQYLITKGMEGLDPDPVSRRTDDTCETSAHIAGCRFSESEC